MICKVQGKGGPTCSPLSGRVLQGHLVGRSGSEGPALTERYASSSGLAELQQGPDAPRGPRPLSGRSSAPRRLAVTRRGQLPGAERAGTVSEVTPAPDPSQASHPQPEHGEWPPGTCSLPPDGLGLNPRQPRPPPPPAGPPATGWALGPRGFMRSSRQAAPGGLCS